MYYVFLRILFAAFVISLTAYNVPASSFGTGSEEADRELFGAQSFLKERLGRNAERGDLIAALDTPTTEDSMPRYAAIKIWMKKFSDDPDCLTVLRRTVATEGQTPTTKFECAKAIEVKDPGEAALLYEGLLTPPSSITLKLLVVQRLLENGKPFTFYDILVEGLSSDYVVARRSAVSIAKKYSEKIDFQKIPEAVRSRVHPSSIDKIHRGN